MPDNTTDKEQDEEILMLNQRLLKAESDMFQAQKYIAQLEAWHDHLVYGKPKPIRKVGGDK